MTIQRFLIRHLHGLSQATLRLGCRITAHIVIVHEVRGCSDVECSFLRPGDLQSIDRLCHRAIRKHLYSAFGPKRTLHALQAYPSTEGGEHIVLHLYTVLQRGIVADPKFQFTALPSLHAHNNHTVGKGSENGTDIIHPIDLVAYGGRGIG